MVKDTAKRRKGEEGGGCRKGKGGGSNKEAVYGVESVYLCTVQDRELKPYVKN